MEHVERSGTYYRVCGPDWADCGDTSYSKQKGGRWNPPGSFGVLYLNKTRQLAALQARLNFVGSPIMLFDLKPERRPHLQSFVIPKHRLVDAVSDQGLAALGLAATYPYRVGHAVTQPIGQAAFDAGEDGIAARSALQSTKPGEWYGEELAAFERSAEEFVAGKRERFAEWYPRTREPKAMGSEE